MVIIPEIIIIKNDESNEFKTTTTLRIKYSIKTSLVFCLISIMVLFLKIIDATFVEKETDADDINAQTIANIIVGKINETTLNANPLKPNTLQIVVATKPVI